MSPPPQDPLAELVTGLALAGRTESSSSGFTLASDKAREKLQEFALSNPENFQLLLLAGLFALGSRHFTVDIDADDLRVSGDFPLDRGAFDDLWGSVAGGQVGSDLMGYRVLAIAILTSVRFDRVNWQIESRDQAGPWVYNVQIRRGEVRGHTLDSQSSGVEGVMIWAKRKSLRQVVSRFIQRTFQAREVEADEIRLFKERVFLPRASSLKVNGQPLLMSSSEDPGSVLASLKSGDAPDLVVCPRAFFRKKEQAMVVLMVDPDHEADSSIPGMPKSVHWIWNGLKMDTTALGLSYDFCRVFVWAPELRTDLSFTSLVDNREKQAMERTARDLVRELLKDVALSLKKDLEAAGVARLDEFAPFRKVILSAIERRIDMSANRKRFASVNRSLIECPIFRVSTEDGTLSLESFADLWGRCEAGNALALFRNREEWRPADPWPGRPLVVYTDDDERALLLKKFGQRAQLSAATMLDELAELIARRRGVTGGVEERMPSLGQEAVMRGNVEVGSESVKWVLNEIDEKALRSKHFPNTGATLQVLRGGRLYFEDRTVPLPPSFCLRTEASWEPNYLGQLADRELLKTVVAEVLLSLLKTFSSQSLENSPSPQDAAVSAFLLASVNGFDAKLFQSSVVRESAWLVAGPPGGVWRWWSPQNFASHLARLDAPLYYGLMGQGLDEVQDVLAWKDLAVLAIPSVLAEVAGRLLGREAESSRGLERLLKKTLAPEDRPNGTWSMTFDRGRCRAVHPSVKVLSVTVLRQGWKPSLRGTVQIQPFLHDRPLAARFVEGAISPAYVEVHWEHGWPDETGKALCGGGNEVLDSHLPALLREAALAFFEQVTPDQIYEATIEFVATGLFEILSEPDLRHRPVLLMANGQRVALKDLPTPEGVGCYFTQSALCAKVPAHAVYAPGTLVEALPLLCEFPWVSLDDLDLPQDPNSQGLSSKSFRGATELQSTVVDSKPVLQPPCKTTNSQNATVEQPEACIQPEDRSPQKSVESGENRRTRRPASKEEESDAPPGLAMKEILLPVSPSPPSVLHSEAQPLIDAFLELEDLDSLPHAPRFLDLLSQLEFGSEQCPTLKVQSSGRVLLGAKCRAALLEPNGRWMLLSALYSAFNRRDADVTDHDEKVFHRRLLRRSLQGREGSAGGD